MAGRSFQSDLRSGRIPLSNANTKTTATATGASDDDDNKGVYSIKIKSYGHGLHAINGAIKEMKRNNKTVNSGELKSGSKSTEKNVTDTQPTFMWIDLNNDKVVSIVKNGNCDDNDMDNYCVHNYNYSSDNSSNDDDDDGGGGGDGDINANKHRNGNRNRDRDRNRNRNSNKCDPSPDFNHQNGSSELCDSPSPSSTSYSSTSSFPSSSSPPYPLDVFNTCDRALDDLYVQCDPGTVILVLTQADIQPLVQLLSEKQRLDFILFLSLFSFLHPYFFLHRLFLRFISASFIFNDESYIEVFNVCIKTCYILSIRLQLYLFLPNAQFFKSIGNVWLQLKCHAKIIFIS